MNQCKVARRVVLRGALFLAAGLVSTTAAHGADDADDLEKLAGTWNWEEPPGGKLPAGGGVVFKGDTIAFVSANGKRTEGKFKIDPTQDPKTMDIDMSGKSLTLAIYHLEGDTLKLCHYLGPKAAKERPKTIAAAKQTVVGILKRKE